MTVVVAVSLLVMFGVGALVVDAGNLYSERRQLQVGAEAGALAAAFDYASGNGAGAAETAARDFATANNVRGANVEDFYQPTPNSVTVETITGDIDAPGTLSALLASVLGIDDYFTRASATAAWGAAGLPPSVLPMTVSMCDFVGDPGPFTPDELDDMAAALPTVAELEAAHGGAVTGGQIIIMHDPGDDDACTFSPGFAEEGETKMPAGFGWLEIDSDCAVNITGYEDDGQFWVPRRGGTYPAGKDCMVAEYQKAPLIPVFTGFQGPPVSEFRLYAPASFYITGIRMPPGPSTPAGMTCPGGGGVWCIRGHFVQRVDAGLPVAGGPSVGVTAIELTG